MIPRYRAKAPVFVRQLLLAGAEFESELPPGRNWEPLNDAAKEAVARHQAANGKVLEIYQRRDPPPVDAKAVEIPPEWESLSGPKRRGLAMKLGAQSNVKVADADSYIRAELERRKAA